MQSNKKDRYQSFLDECERQDAIDQPIPVARVRAPVFLLGLLGWAVAVFIWRCSS